MTFDFLKDSSQSETHKKHRMWDLEYGTVPYGNQIHSVVMCLRQLKGNIFTFYKV